jgi:hypothetical protein
MPRRKGIRPKPPIEAIRQLLDYNPDTGEFKFKRKVSGRPSLHPSGIGGCDQLGYHKIGVARGQQIKSHILAWAIVHGEWPAKDIDHINGDPGDNRIANLRLCEHRENQRNRSVQSNNKLGFKGVHAIKLKSGAIKYRARVVTDGQHRHVGCFDRAEDAAAAYAAVARELHGDFARVS